MAEEVSNRILPVLKTAAPDPTIFEEPTVFKQPKTLDTSSAGFWIKMLLLLLFISLLGLNVYYYLTEGVTLITKFFGDGLENTEKNIEKGAETVEKALEEKEQDSEPTKLETTLDEPRNKDEPTPSPDLSNEADIQLAKKAGYCYVGTLNKKRTCIEIDEDDKCMSGDIFPTRDICMNPNLRN